MVFELILLGLLLIFLGVLILMLSLWRTGEGRAEAGGVVIVGPVPIVFGTSPLLLGLAVKDISDAVRERKKASQITSLPYVAATPIVDQRKAATKIFSDMQGGNDQYIKSSSRKTAAEPHPRFGAAPSFNPLAAVVPPYMKGAASILHL